MAHLLRCVTAVGSSDFVSKGSLCGSVGLQVSARFPRRFEIYTPVLLPTGPTFEAYARVFKLARRHVIEAMSLVENGVTLVWDFSLHSISAEPELAAAEMVPAFIVTY